MVRRNKIEKVSVVERQNSFFILTYTRDIME